MALLFGAILVMSVFEVVGIASVLPFMSIVSAPETIFENEWLHKVYQHFGFTGERQFLIAFGIAVLVTFAFANLFSLYTRWMQHKFTWDSAYSLAQRMLVVYTSMPYSFFLAHNTSDMGKQVLNEVSEFINNFLLPATELCARLLVAFLIFVLLVVVDPLLATIVLGVLGGAYFVIFGAVKAYLTSIGKSRMTAVQQRFKTANEMLEGIKAVKAHGVEDHFLTRFGAASRTFSTVQARYRIVSQAPKFLVETLAFGGIISVVLYVLSTGKGFQEIVPVLSLYALAGYRLLPSLQKLFDTFSSVRFNYPIIDAIYEDLRMEDEIDQSERERDDAEPLEFTSGIHIDDVSFRYPSSDDYVLRKISATIRKNTHVAFVGSTGSGKSTLIDIIMGLLTPEQGRILVDGQEVSGARIRAWRRLIGYVPQDVFLLDDTIISNIAFGVDEEDADLKRVERAARIANMHDFIVSELPDGYHTVVGERGVRLSGGQRQRLGLARALYHEPKVLVLDEATSALDGITEDAVMSSISGLTEDCTAIIVAHRLTTVRHCDRIYLLERGTITDEGTFDELIESSRTFREMARLAS